MAIALSMLEVAGWLKRMSEDSQKRRSRKHQQRLFQKLLLDPMVVPLSLGCHLGQRARYEEHLKA